MTTNTITAGGASDSLAVAAGNDGTLLIQTGPTGAKVNAVSLAADGTPTFLRARGGVAQIQTTAATAVATGTTVIPWDDTIPQNTEGDQYLSQTITPISATSLLEIDVVLMLSSSASVHLSAALFQDATTNALTAESTIANTTAEQVVYLKYLMTSGTTSATTFKVRAGPDVGATITLNGSSSARKFGGVAASRITIKEYLP